jgi:hypothetical protein
MGDGTCELREPREKVFNVLFPPEDFTGDAMVFGATIDSGLGLDRMNGVNGDGGAAPHDGAALIEGTDDGETNKNAWQAAIDFACANNYDEVYIPAGKYRIGKVSETDFEAGVILSAEACPDGLVISGDGMGQTILLTNFGAGGAMIYMADSVHTTAGTSTNARDTHIHGINFAAAPGYAAPASHVEAIVTGISTDKPAIVSFDYTGESPAGNRTMILGLENDDLVRIRNCSGSVELNDKIFRVGNINIDGNEIGGDLTLHDPVGFEIDGAGLTTWVSGPNRCIITPHEPDLKFVLRNFTIMDDDPYSAIQWDHFNAKTHEDFRSGNEYVTGTSTTTNFIFSHLADDDGPVTITTDGTLPTNLLASNGPFFVNINGNKIGFSTEKGGTNLDLSTGSPSGTVIVTYPDKIRLTSEETHGIISAPSGGFVHIDAVEFIGMGDEPIEVFGQSIRVLIENVVCDGGWGHCITINGALSGIIRNNFMFKETRYRSETLVPTANFASGGGGGFALVLEAFGRNRGIMNIEIYGNIIQGDFSSCITLVTNNESLGGGQDIDNIDIYDNTCITNPREAFRANANSINIKQRDTAIRNVHIHDNYLLGRLVIDGTNGQAEMISGIVIENNIIRPRHNGADSHAITVEGSGGIVIRSNDIRNFNGSCVRVQTNDETNPTEKSFSFTSSDVNTAGGFVNKVNPFEDGYGPIRLITSNDDLPFGIADTASEGDRTDNLYDLGVGFEGEGLAHPFIGRGFGNPNEPVTLTLQAGAVFPTGLNSTDVFFVNVATIGGLPSNLIGFSETSTGNNMTLPSDGSGTFNIHQALLLDTDYFLVISYDEPDEIRFSKIKNGRVVSIDNDGTGTHTMLGAYVDAWTFEEGDVTFSGGDFITALNNPFRDRDGPVLITSNGTLPSGLDLLDLNGNVEEYYLVIDPEAPDVIEFSLFRGGEVEPITDAGTGLHTIDLDHRILRLDIIDNTLECGGKYGSNFYGMIGRASGGGATGGRASKAEGDYYNIIGNNMFMNEASLGDRFILVPQHRNDVHIEDNTMLIHPSRKNSKEAIFINGVEGARIVGNTIIGPIRGLFIGGSKSANDILIEGNKFTGGWIRGLTVLPTFGMEINNARNITIRGNTISNYKDQAIYINGHDTNNVVNYTITDNDIIATDGIRFKCTGASTCLSSGYQNVVISNNRIDLAGRSAFDGNGTGAIRLVDVVGGIVSNNYITGTGIGSQQGLVTSGLTNKISVFGNTVKGGGTLQFGTTAVNGDDSCSVTGAVGSDSICYGNVTDTSDGSILPVHTVSFSLLDPVTGDSGKLQWEAPSDLTIISVRCSIDTGTSVTIQLNERVDTTPDVSGVDSLSAGLVCDTDSQDSCAAGCDVDTIQNQPIDLGDPLALEIGTIIGSPTILRVHVRYTID